MSIQQVTSANFNKSSNVNFTAKNNKHKKTPENFHNNSISPSKMSIPLATIFAAMPLNSEAATKLYTRDLDSPKHKIEYVDTPETAQTARKTDGVVIEQRKFKSKTFGDVTISLKSTDGNSKNFEKVEMSFLVNDEIFGLQKYTTKVKGAYTYNYQITSDDGSRSPGFSIKAVWADDNVTATNDERIMNYIKTLVKDPRNNGAIEDKTIVRKIRPTTDGSYQNVPNGDILKNAKPVKIAGKMVYEEDINDNDMGKFKLRFYSTDGNDNNAERVTYQKENHPEVEIVTCYTPLHTFAKDTENPTEFRTGVIVLMDDNFKSYYIENNSLLKFLHSIGFENMYSTEVEYVFVDTGIAAPLVKED